MSVHDSLCMRWYSQGEPLRAERREVRAPMGHELLLRVHACGVCRTDLHIVDGELSDATRPLVPGHEIVGTVIEAGPESHWPVGVRVGVAWLGWTCGACQYCRLDRENLCEHARFTGYQFDGGYAEHVLADSRYCFALPPTLDAEHAAPLLCAGLIGYRSLRMTQDAQRLGIYGFGAAAHIVTQVARWQGRDVFAFTRDGDIAAQSLARTLGACWAGASEMRPPVELDAAIIFAPVGSLVPAALRSVRKAGVVVCGGIHMSDIPQFPYSLLWGERAIRSVANLTREDAREFLALAPTAVKDVTTQRFDLQQANEALRRLRAGDVVGAAVLVP